jgi:hypothetical protein
VRIKGILPQRRRRRRQQINVTLETLLLLARWLGWVHHYV